jgi:hypothetical protein
MIVRIFNPRAAPHKILRHAIIAPRRPPYVYNAYPARRAARRAALRAVYVPRVLHLYAYAPSLRYATPRTCALSLNARVVACRSDLFRRAALPYICRSLMSHDAVI